MHCMYYSNMGENLIISSYLYLIFTENVTYGLEFWCDFIAIRRNKVFIHSDVCLSPYLITWLAVWHTFYYSTLKNQQTNKKKSCNLFFWFFHQHTQILCDIFIFLPLLLWSYCMVSLRSKLTVHCFIYHAMYVFFIYGWELTNLFLMFKGLTRGFTPGNIEQYKNGKEASKAKICS